MRLEMSSPIWGNLIRMLRVPKGNPFPEVIGTFMGRDALSLAVSYLNLGPNDAVVLPVYLCREVLKPFLEKTQVEFYDVGPDLAIDPEHIKKRFSGNRVKMVLMINYFGFLQPYRHEIRNIALDRGIPLIEDCAHSLLTEGSGETGDLSIYSFRKILPLADGGGLRINVQGKRRMPPFHPRIYSNLLSFLAIAKGVLNVRSETLSRAGMSRRKKSLSRQTKPAQKNGRILPLSSFAYNGIGNTSFPDIIRKRRSDYLFWQDLAQTTGLFTPVFSDLPSGVCPLGFPAKANDRDSLKAALEQRGISAPIHWRLPPT